MLVTACFTLIACWFRPFSEIFEEIPDIAGRVFMLATLGVGIALGADVGHGGQTACQVVLWGVVLASNAMFLILLNPIKLVLGVAKSITRLRSNRA